MPYKDPEKSRACALAFYRRDRQLNPEKYRQRARHLYAKQPQKHLERRRLWAEKNRSWLQKYNMEYSKRNPQRMKVLGKKYRQRLKDRVFAQYGGYVCVCCKETNPVFLTIDHIVSGTQKSSTEKKTLYQWLSNNNFPNGFRVLCFNCNLGRNKNGGTCPHEQRLAEVIK